MNQSIITFGDLNETLISFDSLPGQTSVDDKPLGLTVYDITHTGEKGDKGDPGVSGTVGFQYLAENSLGGHRIVIVNTNGNAEYASNDNLSHLGRVIGMTTGAASIGAPVDIISIGEITEVSWNWQLDIPIYLGTNGLLTQTEPSSPGNLFSVIVGFPITANTVFINIGFPVILN